MWKVQTAVQRLLDIWTHGCPEATRFVVASDLRLDMEIQEVPDLHSTQ